MSLSLNLQSRALEGHSDEVPWSYGVPFGNRKPSAPQPSILAHRAQQTTSSIDCCFPSAASSSSHVRLGVHHFPFTRQSSIGQIISPPPAPSRGVKACSDPCRTGSQHFPRALNTVDVPLAGEQADVAVFNLIHVSQYYAHAPQLNFSRAREREEDVQFITKLNKFSKTMILERCGTSGGLVGFCCPWASIT